MPLNLADRIAIRSVIMPRVVAAVTKFALWVLGNANAKLNQTGWAREAIRSPQSLADSVSWYVMDDPAYLENGSSMTDAELQGAVEAAITKWFIQPDDVV